VEDERTEVRQRFVDRLRPARVRCFALGVRSRARQVHRRAWRGKDPLIDTLRLVYHPEPSTPLRPILQLLAPTRLIAISSPFLPQTLLDLVTPSLAGPNTQPILLDIFDGLLLSLAQLPPGAISAVIWFPFSPTIFHPSFAIISFPPPPPPFLLFVLSTYPDRVRIVVKDEEEAEAIWFAWAMTMKFSSIAAAGGTLLGLERDLVIVIRESRRIGPSNEARRVVWLDKLVEGLEEAEPERE
jgi:hypothetical protein